MAELDIVDRRIVARDVDRDRVDIGRDAFGSGHSVSAAKASRPVPVPMSAMFANSRPSRSRISSAQGSRRWLHAGRSQTRGWRRSRNVTPPGAMAVGGRVDEEAAGADRLQPGLAHRHPVRLAELLDARIAAAEPGSVGDRLGGRLVIEIGMDQPFVGLRLVGLVGHQHRWIGAVGEQVSSAAIASPCARVQGTVTRQLNWLRFPSPAARPAAWSARGIVAAGIAVRERRFSGASRSSMWLAEGCGVSRMSQSSAATLAMLAR